MKVGAHYEAHQGCEFILWAPLHERVDVKVFDEGPCLVPMSRDERGYWKVKVGEVEPGTKYCFVLDGKVERPDPASFFQPEGVHGPSQVVDHGAFSWKNNSWRGRPLSEMIIYELHVGTFTPEGTFEGVIDKLGHLDQLGVNAVEIMPVAQFPGERNWGYDGVYPFAVQDSYGGPQGLKALVDACHGRGMSVILDVVYNHLGPEGNYFHDFAPYFTDKYATPWGKAVNFDDAYSDEVRNYFIENALYWFEQYRMDALRLDAVHAIFDQSARPFLQQLADDVRVFAHREKREVHLIAESDLNDTRVIRGADQGGFGLDAQWSDDFHHAAHTQLTGEDTGYYQDFKGASDVTKALRETFVYDGRYSKYRKRTHGNSAKDIPGDCFVISLQNHDQVGNRMLGERLATLASFEACKLSAALLILSPYIPMLFMGEEYMEDNPFLYFISHSDKALIEAVRKGRKAEFASFRWKGEAPDPQDQKTYDRSKLDWDKKTEGRHELMYAFYQNLISLRRSVSLFRNFDKEGLNVRYMDNERMVILRREDQKGSLALLTCFHQEQQSFRYEFDGAPWTKILDTADRRWQGPGTTLPEKTTASKQLDIQPMSLAAYRTEN